jgi:tetratricopeptide (TPR) repeat protein
MQAPARDPSDFCIALRAESTLFMPEIAKSAGTPKRFQHVSPFAFFEVGFIGWIVRVGFAFYLDVSFDGSALGVEKSKSIWPSLVIAGFTEEEKFDAPLEQATTSSLAALQAYSLGRKSFLKGEPFAAIPPLKHAIQLDPNFAQAYAQLGVISDDLRLGEESLRKAYELRERVSEHERFYIELHYHEGITGNWETARQVGELWAQTYPRNPFPLGNLGGLYGLLGQHDKALVTLSEALRLDPGVPGRHLQLVDAYFNLNRFGEARTTAEQTQAKNLDSPDLHPLLYWLAFIENDTNAMAREVEWSEGKPGYEDPFLSLEARRFAYFGRVRKARELIHRAIGSAERAQRKDIAALYRANWALTEATFGNTPEALSGATEALKRSTRRGVQAAAVLALAPKHSRRT